MSRSVEIGSIVKMGKEFTKVTGFTCIDFVTHYILERKNGTVGSVSRHDVHWNGKQFVFVGGAK